MFWKQYKSYVITIGVTIGVIVFAYLWIQANCQCGESEIRSEYNRYVDSITTEIRHRNEYQNRQDSIYAAKMQDSLEYWKAKAGDQGRTTYERNRERYEEAVVVVQSYDGKQVLDFWAERYGSR